MSGPIVPSTLYDKIFANHIVHEYENGTYVLYIDRHMLHEVTSPQAFDGLREAGRRVRRPNLALATADHNVPTRSRKNYKAAQGYLKTKDSLQQCLSLERNTTDSGIPFLGLNSRQQGIVHIVGPELGFTLPGTTIVCGDSHTSTHGAFGALAWGIGTSEVEHVLATQTILANQSKNMNVQVNGKLGQGVTAKDLILHIIHRIGVAGGRSMVIEYSGSTIAGLSMESRMSLCNMSIEGGARAGMVAPDDITFGYLRTRPGIANLSSVEWTAACNYWRSLQSDKGAQFDMTVHIDATDVNPLVSWGTNPEQVEPITGRIPHPNEFLDENKRESCKKALSYMQLQPGTPMQDIRIDKVFIGSCTNARLEDLKAAAAILEGRQISSNVKLAMVSPGSGSVKFAAEREGLDRIFKAAGFQWREAGCSMCCGLNEDALEPSERCASTSNRNFENRQGTGARTHLLSPAMAAAAAIQGTLADARAFPPLGCNNAVTDSRDHQAGVLEEEIEVAETLNEDLERLADPLATTQRATSFKTCRGKIVPFNRPNIDTDQIIPTRFCSTTSKQGLGKGLFWNFRFDPSGRPKENFVLNDSRHKDSSMLLGGANFGCGSSREHAVWSLYDWGFRVILAPSFADIFYNNAFKNGLLLVKLRSSRVVERIQAEVSASQEIEVDLASQTIRAGDGTLVDHFDIEASRKQRLLGGFDDIQETLVYEEKISEFEGAMFERCPWINLDASWLRNIDRPGVKDKVVEANVTTLSW